MDPCGTLGQSKGHIADKELLTTYFDTNLPMIHSEFQIVHVKLLISTVLA